MRTVTVTLDADVYAHARTLARDRKITISAAANELVRRTLGPARRKPMRRGQTFRNSDVDLLPVVKCDRVITSEDVYRIEEMFP